MSNPKDDLPARQIHDNFARLLLSEARTLQGFIRQHLPAGLLKRIDVETAEPLSEHLVDKRLRKYITDLLVRVKKNNKDAYLYFLVELKSTPEKLTALQVMHYTYKAMLKYADKTKDKPVPLVYPLILYHGKTKFKYPTDVRDLIDAEKIDIHNALDEAIALIDLSQVSDNELLDGVRFPVSFIEFVLKHIYDPDLLKTLKNCDQFMDLFQQYSREFGQKRAFVVLQYLYASGNISNKDEFAEVVSRIDPAFREEVMTLREAAIQEGIQIGKSQGMQQGVQQAITASKILSMGEPVERVAMVSGLSIEEVRQLASRQSDVIESK